MTVPGQKSDAGFQQFCNTVFSKKLLLLLVKLEITDEQ
jgi:hypothetical protein